MWNNSITSTTYRYSSLLLILTWKFIDTSAWKWQFFVCVKRRGCDTREKVLWHLLCSNRFIDNDESLFSKKRNFSTSLIINCNNKNSYKSSSRDSLLASFSIRFSSCSLVEWVCRVKGIISGGGDVCMVVDKNNNLLIISSRTHVVIIL